MYSEEMENQIEEQTITAEIEKIRGSNEAQHIYFQGWLDDLDKEQIKHHEKIKDIENYIAKEQQRRLKIRENIQIVFWFIIIAFVAVTSVAGFGYLTGMMK
jgi:hypothetical protein